MSSTCWRWSSPTGTCVGPVEQDVGGHQHRVGVERDPGRVHAAALLLELDHPVQLAGVRRALEQVGRARCAPAPRLCTNSVLRSSPAASSSVAISRVELAQPRPGRAASVSACRSADAVEAVGARAGAAAIGRSAPSRLPRVRWPVGVSSESGGGWSCGAPGVRAARAARRVEMHDGRPWAAVVEVGVLERWSAVRRATTEVVAVRRHAVIVQHVQRTGSVPGMDARAGPATVVFDPSLTEYDFGPDAPDVPAPGRPDDAARRGARASSASGLRHGRRRRWPATTLIATVHDPELIEAVTRAGDHRRARRRARAASAPTTTRSSAACTTRPRTSSARPSRRSARCGAARACTAPTSPAACTTRCRDRASGFCIYNDVAVGIQYLLDQGAERVAYVDVDVHHGDGVEQIFWDDPRVLTISAARDRPDALPRHRLPDRPRRSRRARARRSTSRCRRAPATPAGCAPSTPSCRRCCASSRPRCWSPSTAATPTSRTRSPT